MSGLQATVLGHKVSVNLNAKKGYRVSPGKNKIAMAIQEKCKGIKGRQNARDCFGSTAHSMKGTAKGRK